jgi:hypothetical protein
MQSVDITAFEKFVEDFAFRYMREIENLELPEEEILSEEDMLQLFCEFKASGKTPEQWFEQQELS